MIGFDLKKNNINALKFKWKQCFHSNLNVFIQISTHMVYRSRAIQLQTNCVYDRVMWIYCIIVRPYRVLEWQFQCRRKPLHPNQPHPLPNLHPPSKNVFADVRDVFHGQLNVDLTERVISEQHWEYDPGSQFINMRRLLKDGQQNGPQNAWAVERVCLL